MTEYIKQYVDALRMLVKCDGSPCSQCEQIEVNGKLACSDLTEFFTDIARLIERLWNIAKDRNDLSTAFVKHAFDQIVDKKGPYICRYCAHGGDPNTMNPGKDCPPRCNGVSHWEWGGLPDQSGGAEHD